VVSGGISLWLALKGAEVTSSDIKPVGDDLAIYHQRYGVADRISYEIVDVLNIPYREAFDIITFKSVIGRLGGIGGATAQRRAFSQMHAALKPGGRLLFAENISATWLHGLLRKYWGAGRRGDTYAKLDELRTFLSDGFSYKIETTGLIAALGRSERQRRILGRFDRVFSPLAPRGWHYLAYGVAEKLHESPGAGESR
jgi:SAM-dependent methyltransferase